MLLLIILWLSWCTLHSLLITTSVKRWFDHRGGLWLGLYRLGYVCFSLSTLVPLLRFTATLPQQPFGVPPHWLRGVQWMLLLYALVLFVGGLRVYDLQTFLGLRQWRDDRTDPTSVPPAFRKTGILRHVRHPWYSGGIALLWSLPEYSRGMPTLLTRSILSAYLIVGALLEERKLRKSFGDSYLSYCREVPMLLPWKFGRSERTASSHKISRELNPIKRW